MGCIFAIVAGFFPRLGLFIVWVFWPRLVDGIIHTLVAHGMVEQERDSLRYRLGPATLRLGKIYLDTLELRSRVTPWAEDLARRTGCAVRTGVLLGERAAQLARSGLGRRDDVALIVRADSGGRPPAQLGSSARSPISLNRWITSRTVSSCAATSRAIAGTGVPDADAMMINARRTRTESSCLPRRTICCSRRPSSSVRRRARTGSAMPPTPLSTAK